MLVLLFAAFLIVRSVAARSRQPHTGSPASPPRTPPRTRPRQGTLTHRAPEPVGIPGDWRLILDSQFTGGSLNANIWRQGWFGTGITGPINSHESACYSPSNVQFSRRGTLDLIVSAARSTCESRTRPFTGAVLTTNPNDGRAHGGFTYRYGVLQAKVYLPAAGSRIADWPAVVTLGHTWPRDGEDDVMESLGGVACSHFHSPGYAPGGNLGGCDPGLTPGWHIFSSDWEPGSVTWYYDGTMIAHAARGITSAPMYLVLVNTVSARAPQVARADTMRVAYVRVWQRAPVAASASASARRP